MVLLIQSSETNIARFARQRKMKGTFEGRGKEGGYYVAQRNISNSRNFDANILLGTRSRVSVAFKGMNKYCDARRVFLRCFVFQISCD